MLFIVLDAVWHGGIMADFYGRRLLMLNPASGGMVPSFAPFIFLLEAINAVTLTYFVLHCAPSGKMTQDALWIGALLGFTVTGSVNFLNHTLMPWWDIQMALVDTAAGTLIGMITATVVAAVTQEHKRGFFGFLRRG